VLNARVLSLRVLPNEDSVDVVIRSFEALDRSARTDVGEKVKGSAKGQVQGDVALANYLMVRVRSTWNGKNR
jgi:hypothetical protein